MVAPLQDRAKVEQFRKEIGLFPLAQYLDIYKQQTGAKEIKYMEDEQNFALYYDNAMDFYYEKDIYYITPWGWSEPLDSTKSRIRRASAMLSRKNTRKSAPITSNPTHESVAKCHAGQRLRMSFKQADTT